MKEQLNIKKKLYPFPVQKAQHRYISAYISEWMRRVLNLKTNM